MQAQHKVDANEEVDVDLEAMAKALASPLLGAKKSTYARTSPARTSATNAMTAESRPAMHTSISTISLMAIKMPYLVQPPTMAYKSHQPN